MKVLADDGVDGGAWDVTLGDRRRCFALGYEVTPSYARPPEGQLLAGLPWRERSYSYDNGPVLENDHQGTVVEDS